METAITTKNWAFGETPSVLNNIHKSEVNIAIFDRGISPLKQEVVGLLKSELEFRSSGSTETIFNDIANNIELSDCNLIKQDIKDLLQLFSKVTNAHSFRLLLASVRGDMCMKFHTDINDLRMLCTYEGPGTLWLTEDNINQEATDASGEDDCVVIDQNRIQQVKTGSVVILKGAIYPKEGTKPILHRSPSIEENGGERLLLRIDTNEFANF